MPNITITDASGAIRSTNWPPANNTDPVMLDDVRDEARAAAQAEYDAIRAIKVYSYGRVHQGIRKRFDSDTQTSEYVDA